MIEGISNSDLAELRSLNRRAHEIEKEHTELGSDPVANYARARSLWEEFQKVDSRFHKRYEEIFGVQP